MFYGVYTKSHCKWWKKAKIFKCPSKKHCYTAHSIHIGWSNTIWTAFMFRCTCRTTKVDLNQLVTHPLGEVMVHDCLLNLHLRQLILLDKALFQYHILQSQLVTHQLDKVLHQQNVLIYPEILQLVPQLLMHMGKVQHKQFTSLKLQM